MTVAFDDGQSFTFSAELLRVTSPSAEVQGHSEAERKTVGGKRNVAILSVDAVGNYAVRIGLDIPARSRDQRRASLSKLSR